MSAEAIGPELLVWGMVRHALPNHTAIVVDCKTGVLVVDPGVEDVQISAALSPDLDTPRDAAPEGWR